MLTYALVWDWDSFQKGKLCINCDSFPQNLKQPPPNYTSNYNYSLTIMGLAQKFLRRMMFYLNLNHGMEWGSFNTFDSLITTQYSQLVELMDAFGIFWPFF